MSTTFILVILKLLMILVSAGWVSLWLLKPTKLWTRKWKAAEEYATTTVFGYNGLDFAVYTFPVLAVAILGFIYMELKPKGLRTTRKTRIFVKALSKMLIVNSYIGILSAMELVSVLLFILFLTWTFYIRISNDFKKMVPVKLLELNMWQYRLSRVATRCGLLAEACLVLLLLPILRGLSVFHLIGVQFEASIRYHIWLGTSMILFATLHGAGTFFIWGVKHQVQDKMWQWQKKGRINLAGEIALVTGLAIWLTSLPHIRRKKFELFYYTHHLYLIFFVFFLFHTGDRHFYMVLPGLKYTPTSVIFMKVPSISKLQWHSFSLSSSSGVDEHTMSVIIKCEGDWTDSLYNLIQAKVGLNANQFKSIPISIEGPYGPDSLDFLRYESLLFIAGGIGITPFLSILQEIGHTQSSTKREIPTHIQLVYIVKKSQYVCILDSVLSLLRNQSEKMFHLSLKLYVTQEQLGGNFQELVNEFCMVKLVNFDIRPSSYPTHGPASLLWVAVIIGLSSIKFLMILCFFNRAFLHSKDKTSKQKNSSSEINFFLLCSFVIALISGSFLAFLLRKKRSKKELPQGLQKSHKEIKPNTIETSSVLEEQEVYYGKRPDFQDIFSEFSNEIGGSDIGVLVCGPESMKESVASLCRMSSQGITMGAKRNKPYFSFHSLNFTV